MSLNVIGLISGGKDSLYNLAHCVQNGHRIVALANLHPSPESQDGDRQNTELELTDLNSFMYQTVGHSLIHLYADALDVPLYRRTISGTATQTGRDYDTSGATASSKQTSDVSVTPTDETEDMCLLIRNILAHHPEANALSAGAILSTYQRTRVESVAVRLGLTPLAYLWQYPTLPPPPSRSDSLTGLLDDMATAGCEARIIKIASGGIRDSLLFANVTDSATRTQLLGGLAQFFTDEGQEAALRGAVLGEGGEYETLALNGPSPPWKKYIQVEDTTTFDAEGGTSYIKFGRASVVEKQSDRTADVPIPAPFDLRFQAVLNESSSLPTPLSANSFTNVKSGPLLPAVPTAYKLSSSAVQITNLTAQPSSSPSTAATQLTHILTSTLPALLHTISKTHNLLPSRLILQNIVHSTLLLRSIDAFGPVNNTYASHLWPTGLPIPPSRVTVAAQLPPNVEVSFSLVFDLENTVAKRKGLHVQSRSHWAPANIGPYSQAVNVPMWRNTGPANSGAESGEESTRLSVGTEVVHIAGQIPLVPSSMALSDAPFEEQAVLALQHLWRIGQERGVDMWASPGVAYLASAPGSSGGSVDRAAVVVAAEVWWLAHAFDEKGKIRQDGQQDAGDDNDEEDEGLDVWDLQRNRGFANAAVARMTVGEHLHVLPNDNVFGNRPTLNGYMAPFIAVEVSALPRNASIEWWSMGIVGLVSAVKQNQCIVVTRTERFADWGSASMLIIKTRNAGHGYGEETEDIPVGIQECSCFITLVIEEGIAANAEYPRSIDDISRKLLVNVEECEFASIEIVTAQSFVSVTSEQGLSVAESSLVRNSTVVPCGHVWTGSSHSPNQGTLRDIAAAVLLRVDTRSI